MKTSMTFIFTLTLASCLLLSQLQSCHGRNVPSSAASISAGDTHPELQQLHEPGVISRRPCTDVEKKSVKCFNQGVCHVLQIHSEAGSSQLFYCANCLPGFFGRFCGRRKGLPAASITVGDTHPELQQPDEESRRPCADVEKKSVKCFNQGVCHVLQIHSVAGSSQIFYCANCLPGFFGRFCERRKGLPAASITVGDTHPELQQLRKPDEESRRPCTDVEKKSVKCFNQGVCHVLQIHSVTDSSQLFYCKCPPRFFGRYCKRRKGLQP